MPEGDAVWRTARRLHKALAGQPLVRSELRWGSLGSRDLTGATTLEVVPRGKHLLHRLDSGLTLHSHLRMEGSWRLDATTTPPSPLRNHRIRAVLATPAWTAVGWSLGMLDLLRTPEEHRLLGRLGPDLLGGDWDADRAAANLATASATLGEALLDQRNLAGLGTIWTAETLFAEQLSPWTSTSALGTERLRRVADRAHALLTGAVVAGARPWEHYRVYRRLHQPCPRCGTPVAAGRVGAGTTEERTLFYCPRCQPRP